MRRRFDGVVPVVPGPSMGNVLRHVLSLQDYFTVPFSILFFPAFLFFSLEMLFPSLNALLDTGHLESRSLFVNFSYPCRLLEILKPPFLFFSVHPPPLFCVRVIRFFGVFAMSLMCLPPARALLSLATALLVTSPQCFLLAASGEIGVALIGCFGGVDV